MREISSCLLRFLIDRLFSGTVYISKVFFNRFSSLTTQNRLVNRACILTSWHDFFFPYYCFLKKKFKNLKMTNDRICSTMYMCNNSVSLNKVTTITLFEVWPSNSLEAETWKPYISATREVGEHSKDLEKSLKSEWLPRTYEKTSHTLNLSYT